jgi:hypothetical protein
MKKLLVLSILATSVGAVAQGATSIKCSGGSATLAGRSSIYGAELTLNRTAKGAFIDARIKLEGDGELVGDEVITKVVADETISSNDSGLQCHFAKSKYLFNCRGGSKMAPMHLTGVVVTTTALDVVDYSVTKYSTFNVSFQKNRTIIDAEFNFEDCKAN